MDRKVEIERLQLEPDIRYSPTINSLAQSYRDKTKHEQDPPALKEKREAFRNKVAHEVNQRERSNRQELIRRKQSILQEKQDEFTQKYNMRMSLIESQQLNFNEISQSKIRFNTNNNNQESSATLLVESSELFANPHSRSRRPLEPSAQPESQETKKRTKTFR